MYVCLLCVVCECRLLASFVLMAYIESHRENQLTTRWPRLSVCLLVFACLQVSMCVFLTPSACTCMRVCVCFHVLHIDLMLPFADVRAGVGIYLLQSIGRGRRVIHTWRQHVQRSRASIQRGLPCAIPFGSILENRWSLGLPNDNTRTHRQTLPQVIINSGQIKRNSFEVRC